MRGPGPQGLKRVGLPELSTMWHLGGSNLGGHRAKHSPSTSGVGLPYQTLEQLQDREKYSRAHNLLALISQFKVIVVNYFIIGKYNLVYFVASPHSSGLS